MPAVKASARRVPTAAVPVTPWPRSRAARSASPTPRALPPARALSLGLTAPLAPSTVSGAVEEGAPTGPAPEGRQHPPAAAPRSPRGDGAVVLDPTCPGGCREEGRTAWDLDVLEALVKEAIDVDTGCVR